MTLNKKQKARRLLAKIAPEEKTDLLFSELEETRKEMEKKARETARRLSEASTRHDVSSMAGELERLRRETLSRFANIQVWGNANREILVGSSVVSSKFTDIDFQGLFTAIDDNATKRVVFTGSASGDPFTQYALLAGRATPQTLAFGTAASAATGYLTSTSNATKGKYFLNAAGTIAVDELNTRLGIGTATPVSGLEVAGDALVTLYGDGVNPRLDLVRVANNQQWRLSAGATKFQFRDLVGEKNVFEIESGSPEDAFYIKSSGVIGFGTAAPSGQLHIDQASTTGAIPVLYLDQADVSEEFIRLVGTSAASDLTQSLVRPASVSTATVAAYVEVYVSDTSAGITAGSYYMPLYTLT